MGIIRISTEIKMPWCHLKDWRFKEEMEFLLSAKHLCKYAADTPEIHGRGVAGLEQDFWGSVPQCNNLQQRRDLSMNEKASCRTTCQSCEAHRQDSGHYTPWQQHDKDTKCRGRVHRPENCIKLHHPAPWAPISDCLLHGTRNGK